MNKVKICFCNNYAAIFFLLVTNATRRCKERVEEYFRNRACYGGLIQRSKRIRLKKFEEQRTKRVNQESRLKPIAKVFPAGWCIFEFQSLSMLE